ncbi:amp dependent CoA ligase [Auriscalpium vulgare]|uniref:Amp dependent CoA ligase n=1 Tax=Auriscalpium vulgare TaxID=40419 RepID=A0ACB8R9X1_9AGAM|nr:amp dependent CoA ligase [Auriscalpium vulgare]
MTEFVSLSGPLPHVPDDVTLVQFILDATHPSRPLRHPDSPWLIEDATGRTVSFEEIRTRVWGLANALSLKWDIREDEVVCIFSPNHVDYPVALWATHRLGAIVTAANPAFGADELAYQLTTAKAVAIIAHPAFLSAALGAAKLVGIPPSRVIPLDASAGPAPSNVAPNVDELIKFGLANKANFQERRLNPGEAKTKLAFLSFSSGTTGKPKAVEIPHFSPIANIIQKAAHYKFNEPYTTWENMRFRPGDVATAVLPMFHIYGLIVNIHFLLFAGQTLVVTPKFEFTKYLDSIVKYRITHLLVVPPMVLLLCKHPAVKKYDLSHVRFVLCGAAPLSAQLVSQLVKVIPNAYIGQGYGMTETATTVALFPLSQKIGTPGSAGQLVPGVRARVVKEDGSLAAAGEQGELVVTGPSMAMRYSNNEQGTKETFVDGWVRTGDEVIIDKNGDLFIVDRLKEIMKVRGFQVAPAELEGHLLTHPDIADTCVVGIPDEYSGEVPLAFVSLQPHAARRVASDSKEADVLKANIAKFVTDHKVYYKRLAGGVVFLDAIPKNPSGKLLRRVLRDQAKKLVAAKSSQQKSKL